MQLILVIISVAAAVAYLVRRFYPFAETKKESCAGCASAKKKGPAEARPL